MFFSNPGSTVYAHENHHPFLAPGILPSVPVDIRNDTDAFLSLTISSTCLPRVILKPGESRIVSDCLEQGRYYHAAATFYNQQKVLERYDFLFLVKPGHPWIFCKLSQNKSQCK